MNAEKYQNLISDAIEFYKSSKKENIDEILSDFLNSQNVSENTEESKTLVSSISDIIDNISENYNKIKIDRANENQPKQPNDIIKENFQSILKDSQNDEQINISENVVNEINDITDNKDKNEYNIVESPVEYSQKLNEDINSLITLDAITYEKLDSEISNDLQLEIKNLDLNDFYNSEFNSEEEQNIKKTISAASYVALKKKIIKSHKNEKVFKESLPYIIDKNLSQSKIYYKFGKKEISSDSALDELIDRYTAILVSVVEKKSGEIGQNVGAKVGSYVGSIYGPVGTSIGFELGRVFGRLAGEKVGNIISTGIKEFSTVLKTTASDVIEKVKNGYNNVKNSFKNLFS